MWWLNGIFRDVCITSQPEYHIYDIFAKTSLDEKYENGILDLEVDIASKNKKNRNENSFSLEIILKNINSNDFLVKEEYSLDSLHRHC